LGREATRGSEKGATVSGWNGMDEEKNEPVESGDVRALGAQHAAPLQGKTEERREMLRL